MFTSILRQNQTLGGEENLFAIQVNVCYILNTLKIGKRYLFIFIIHEVTSFSFSPRSSVHSLKIRMTSHPLKIWTDNAFLSSKW